MWQQAAALSEAAALVLRYIQINVYDAGGDAGHCKARRGGGWGVDEEAAAVGDATESRECSVEIAQYTTGKRFQNEKGA